MARWIIYTITVVLVVLSITLPLLKLCHVGPVATWSWLQVAAPIWGSWVLALLGALVYLFILLLLTPVPRR